MKANTSDKQAGKFAKAKSELAHILGITRRTLDAWLLEPDAPRRTKDGRYEIEHWREFASHRKVNMNADEASRLLLQKLRNEVELGNLRLLKEAGELVPLEWTKMLLGHVAILTSRLFWNLI